MAFVAGVQHVEVNHRGVVHDVCIMFASEYIPCSPHVGRKLIHFIKALVYDTATESWVAQVSNHEIIGRCGRKLGILEVYAAYPVTFSFSGGAPDDCQ
jgi:hypothetical protein